MFRLRLTPGISLLLIGAFIGVMGAVWYTQASLFSVVPWLAAGLIGIAGCAFVPRARDLANRAFARRPEDLEKLKRAAPYALAICIVAWALWPIPFDLPVSQDHAHHYLNTSIALDLVSSGHLFGWTDRVSTGLPFGDVYGTPAYVVTGLLRAATLGLVSLATSYSVGIFMVWLVAAWAVVAMVRRILPQAYVVAPSVACAAFVLDPGGDREGGWVYSMFHAVWPQLFATAVVCWAFIALFRLAEEPTRRRLGAAILALGFAFWMHPMNAVNLLLASGVIIGIWSVKSHERTPGLWLIVAFALAAVIGWGWLSHLHTARDAMSSYSAGGIPFDELGVSLWQGLFENAFSGWGVLGAVGIVAAIAVGTRFASFVVAMLVVYLLAASTVFLVGFDLGLWEKTPEFMWRRFSITAKPFWFVLVGLGAGVIADGVRAVVSGSEASPVFYRRVPVWMMAGPLLAVTLAGAWIWVPGPAARPLTAGPSGLGDELQALAQTLVDERDAMSRVPRVLYWHERGDHGDYALFSIADAGVGYVPNRTPPCQTFSALWSNKSLELARFSGATHVVTHREVELEDTVEIGRTANFWIYRFEPDDAPVLARVNGEARATVKAWEPMRRVIALEGTDAYSVLELAMPPYKKWSAELDGQAIDLDERRTSGSRLLTLHDLKDGVLTLEFEDTALERGSFAAALLVALFALLLLTSSRSLGPLAGPKWGRRAQVAVAWGVASAIVAGYFGARYLGDESRHAYWLADEDFKRVEVLHHRAPDRFEYEPDPYCVRPRTRRPRAGCYEAVLEPKLRRAPAHRGVDPSCMQVGVPDNGAASLEWRFEGSSALVRVHADRGVKAWRVDDERESIDPGKTLKFEVDGALKLEFENRSNTAYVCVEAAIVE